MLIQSNIYVLSVIFLSLLLSVMTLASNCQNITETICDGTLPNDNGNHTQLECMADLFSSIEVLSCENEPSNLNMYWFWYDDVCRSNLALNKFFAIVYPDNITEYSDRSDISITQESCEKDWIFTRQSMTIKNIANSTSQKYMCLLSDSQFFMDYTSAVIHSISMAAQFISFDLKEID